MGLSYIVKLNLAGTSTQAVLLHATPKGENELDLDLLATDGDAAFRGKVRARSLDKLRAKNYDGSTEQWTSTLKYGLVSRQTEIEQAVKDNLEIDCAISGKDPKRTLSISFRTRVQDITQRLGSIELPQTEDDDDVDLFGWAAQLADRRDQLAGEAAKQERKASAEAKTIDALQKQLDELTEAKAEHEHELVSKFAMLLNEKKRKLRQLKQVLETAQVDPGRLTAIEGLVPPGGRRGKKRSAREAGQADESDESDGFEDMDVDKPIGARRDDDAEERAQQTTDDEDSELEDEDLDQPVMSQTEAGSDGPSKPPAKTYPAQPMPARRELPFTRQSKQADKDKGTGKDKDKGKARTPTPQTIDDDEETASEEDEL